MIRRRVVVAAAAALMSLGALPADAAPGVRVLPLPPGASFIAFQRISGTGLVYGQVQRPDGSRHATVWRGDSVRELAPAAASSTAVHANDLGLVAGTITPAGAVPAATRATAWFLGRTFDLHPAGAQQSYAVDVNNRGEVLVEAYFPGPTPDERGVEQISVWRAGSVRVLHRGPQGNGYPVIGDGGHVAASVVDGAGTSAVRVWDGRGRVLADVTPAETYVSPFPLDVNTRGEVLIQAYAGYVQGRMYLWRNGTAVAVSGLPGARDVQANPFDFFNRTFLNDAGEVVATSDYRAFRWRDGVATPLAPQGGFSYPQGINERGDVAVESCAGAIHDCTPQIVSRAGETTVITGPPGSGPNVLVSDINRHRRQVVGVARDAATGASLGFVQG
ncbi:hypothetical protein [Actinokineospora spheciospongiae]|uniref:hypothetical protein n=1 Tax=Actinokineospora spheciospongiae TaxID=909613 RepID=UPI000DA0E0E1|nr:hypothetical protein [Actinokineospora spheciospongiae]PWW53751.1 hypothetical protein DFQ13_115136 [Actinokineospora spheciospongiae]